MRAIRRRLHVVREAVLAFTLMADVAPMVGASVV
jgi:hypothetical protein